MTIALRVDGVLAGYTPPLRHQRTDRHAITSHNKHLLSASTELLQKGVGVEAPRRARQKYERCPARYFGGRREHVQVEVIDTVPGSSVEAEPVVVRRVGLGLLPLAHLEGDAPHVLQEWDVSLPQAVGVLWPPALRDHEAGERRVIFDVAKAEVPAWHAIE